MKYLLKIETNWADEIDIDGACILTKKEYEKFTQKTSEFEEDENFYMCVGTNEEIDCEWCNVANDFEVIEITEEQANVLKQLGMSSIGFARTFYESCCFDDDEE